MNAFTIQLTDPGQFIAAVPHLLGFYPTDSLVLVGVTGNPPQPVITVRTDLPPVEHQLDLADQLFASLNQYVLDGVLAVIVTASADTWPLPEHHLAEVIDHVFEHGGLPLLHRLWAATLTADTRTPWRCYDDPDCRGMVPTAAETPVAAAVSAAGFTTFASRQDLAALLAPADEQTLARRERCMEEAARAACLDEDHVGRRAAEQRDLDLVLHAISEIQRGNDVFGDEEIARLAMALTNPGVRDASLAALGDDRAEATERLWLLLTRGTPEPERAEPAALLAFAAYLRGDGALASVALEVAEAACPNHGLTTLLTAYIQFGFPPARLRVLVDHAAASEHVEPDPTD